MGLGPVADLGPAKTTQLEEHEKDNTFFFFCTLLFIDDVMLRKQSTFQTAMVLDSLPEPYGP